MAMGAGAAKGRGRRRRAPMAEINVTPMVDVMLVLLIIFMVAAPLLVTGVSVDLPQTAAKALPSDNEPISVTIDRAGQRSIGSELLGEAAFDTRLQALKEARPDARVVIRADASLPYGQVAALLADVTGVGFTKVALVNRPVTIEEAPAG
ncbi:ExbD/TolR family protein [Sandaracinobacter sp. RS1-74]|uniref:ExbD/TolR family protein n=1 Tax=Sandaracinobacteroides sayramensis TaxID=2913411 RepID=UPI001EDB4A47|nr:ExbD/TolR family protein [Sandaracinobacteroides sayramensis]MCG2839800.1 ExbD/TolR family protein [Sandaracinobacteroides sayramensis]